MDLLPTSSRMCTILLSTLPKLLRMKKISPPPVADQEELGAYQSLPKPSCSCSFYHIGSAEASDGEGLHEYETVDWNSLWHRPSSPTSEYESDYDPSSMGRSLSAQWNGSQLTDSVLCPFHYAFDNVENFPVEGELQDDPYRFAHFQGVVPG
eukprot:3680678-Amphidinium_carterae.1